MVDTILFQTYLTALLAGRPKECNSMVQSLMDAGTDFTQLYIKLFKHSLCSPWQFQNVNQSVAQEHLLELISESVLDFVCPTMFSGKNVARKKLLSMTSDEFHYAGGKVVTYNTAHPLGNDAV